MGLISWYSERLRRSRAQFRETHLGAEQRTGDAAGQGAYRYTVYQECEAAAVMECLSLVLTVAVIGAVFVWLRHADSVLDVFFALAAVILCREVTKRLAQWVNQVSVKRRIRESAEYAKYFAVRYPEQAYLCAELNEIYAVNPDAIPYLHQNTDDSRIKRCITVLGIGFLILVLAALIAFCIWVKHETE